MGSLLLNENMKLYRRIRTWIMIGIMIVIIGFVNFAAWNDYSNDPKSATWQGQVAAEKQSRLQALQKPDLSKESQSYNEEMVALYDYQLEHDIRPVDGTLWMGINLSTNFVILITLFTVIVAGDSMAGEFSSGTIKLLLIRPHNRLKILLSKYVSMILFGITLLIILFIVSILINGMFYGFRHIDLPLLSVNADDGNVLERSMVANLLQTYLLKGVATIMFVTIAFMISTAFRSSAMAIGFSLFAMFAGQIATEFLRSYAWSKYILFANIDLTPYLSGHPYQEGMTLAFSVAVLCVYFILFNLVSWIVFMKRDVAA
ncbi:ABC transporter permease [Paenibacillus lignilyticus]|uniref:ABC transporter permease n=1 Tax=Paenibacillus lignilyticus TaxID=1172615 RepID=A0ABS5CN80_9BACL|nr:ABC transporter permease [Paenibacillus lignilyticus]MBP3967309.1 ABC transporter permease [Paenibacillus lignilyticus]